MDPGAMTHLPSFLEIGSAIQKLIRKNNENAYTFKMLPE
jgi:hypothetical protein